MNEKFLEVFQAEYGVIRGRKILRFVSTTGAIALSDPKCMLSSSNDESTGALVILRAAVKCRSRGSASHPDGVHHRIGKS